MTLLEIMERCGIREPELAKVYIRDAMREMQSLIPEKTTYTVFSVVTGQRNYDMPANMVKLLGVYSKYTTSQYRRISIISNVDIVEQETSTAVGSTEIVVL